MGIANSSPAEVPCQEGRDTWCAKPWHLWHFQQQSSVKFKEARLLHGQAAAEEVFTSTAWLQQKDTTCSPVPALLPSLPVRNCLAMFPVFGHVFVLYLGMCLSCSPSACCLPLLAPCQKGDGFLPPASLNLVFVKLSWKSHVGGDSVNCHLRGNGSEIWLVKWQLMMQAHCFLVHRIRIESQNRLGGKSPPLLPGMRGWLSPGSALLSGSCREADLKIVTVALYQEFLGISELLNQGGPRVGTLSLYRICFPSLSQDTEFHPSFAGHGMGITWAEEGTGAFPNLSTSPRCELLHISELFHPFCSWKQSGIIIMYWKDFIWPGLAHSLTFSAAFQNEVDLCCLCRTAGLGFPLSCPWCPCIFCFPEEAVISVLSHPHPPVQLSFPLSQVSLLLVSTHRVGGKLPAEACADMQPPRAGTGEAPGASRPGHVLQGGEDPKRESAQLLEFVLVSGVVFWVNNHPLLVHFPPPAVAVSRRTKMHFLIAVLLPAAVGAASSISEMLLRTWAPSPGYMFHTAFFQFLVLLSQHSIAMAGRNFSGRQFTLRLPQIIIFEISTDFIIRVWFCLQP